MNKFIVHNLLIVISVWLLSDVSFSDECRTKKYFQCAEKMIPLFFPILKFCSTKHLFNLYQCLNMHAPTRIDSLCVGDIQFCV